jgi:hypothetical protein
MMIADNEGKSNILGGDWKNVSFSALNKKL